MMLDEVLSMEPVREKLRNLRQYMPDQEETVYRFGEFLAERLKNPELVPLGFCLEATLSLYDLQKGVDGYTGKPINSALVGYPQIVYNLLYSYIPAIAEAVCPEDFAKGVKQAFEQIEAETSKK